MTKIFTLIRVFRTFENILSRKKVLNSKESIKFFSVYVAFDRIKVENKKMLMKIKSNKYHLKLACLGYHAHNHDHACIVILIHKWLPTWSYQHGHTNMVIPNMIIPTWSYLHGHTNMIIPT